jgi:hypothetical protein
MHFDCICFPVGVKLIKTQNIVQRSTLVGLHGWVTLGTNVGIYNVGKGFYSKYVCFRSDSIINL